MVQLRRLKYERRLSYFLFCNVLRIWTIRAIPTYRVYRLYDSIQYHEYSYELKAIIVHACLNLYLYYILDPYIYAMS